MFQFEEMIHEVDHGLIRAFGVPVDILRPDETITILGIFDNPAALSAFNDGGWIADTDPELFIMEEESGEIFTRDEIRVDGKIYQVLRPPQRDSAGMVKLVLGNRRSARGNENAKKKDDHRQSISY